MPLPREFIDELIDRNDIADVAGSYTQLKRAGRRLAGLCPFHNEKTPSFTVFQDTRSFYCFGCGASGDVISFIMKAENLSYMEAVKYLAQRAGMEMPENTDSRLSNLRTRILAANREAARFFFRSLNSEAGKEARGYLRRRGLKDSTITRFGIGYAPDSWSDLRDHLYSLGFKEEEVLAAGLCRKSQKGSVLDFFRDRVMFPVIDLTGNVVAFSGRRLKDNGDPRKYVNTTDTLVFKKSKVLFAMNLAKNSLARSREIILAEGQMDAISMHQAGFDNAVAALGTALTEEHIKIMSNYADSVVIAYDADEAGRKATQRAIGLFRNSPLSIKVLDMTGAKDADEYINKYGPEMFRKLIDGSAASLEYELKRAEAKYDLFTDDGKVRYLREATDIVAKSMSPTERDIYAGRLADKTSASKESIVKQIESAIRRKKRNEQADREQRLTDVQKRYDVKAQNRRQIGGISAEHRLIALVYWNPDKRETVKTKLGGVHFSDGDLEDIFDHMMVTEVTDPTKWLSYLSEDLGQDKTQKLSHIVNEYRGISFVDDDIDYLCDKIKSAANRLNDRDIGNMDPEALKKMIDNKSGGGSNGR